MMIYVESEILGENFSLGKLQATRFSLPSKHVAKSYKSCVF